MNLNPASPRYLTKSRFKLAVDCPTKLYYAGKPREYRSTLADNSFMMALAEGGFQVGEMAKLMYPGGIEVTAKNNTEAEAQTLELLQRDNVVLFEPAIRHGNLFIRVDVLVKRGNAFDVIEVKAKSFDSDKPSFMGARGKIAGGMLPYLQDVAFQTYVLKLAYPAATVASFLLMPDKTKVAKVDGLNQLFKLDRSGSGANRPGRVVVNPAAAQLPVADTVLTLVNVDEQVALILHDDIEFPGGAKPLPEVVAEWADAYQNDVRVTPSIGTHCASCEFVAEPGDALRSGFHECWKDANGWKDADFAGGTVLDIWNFRGKGKLIERGILKPGQVTQAHLNYKTFDDGLSNQQRQWMQVNGLPDQFKARGYYIDRGYVQRQMAQWVYPLHLIDFETAMVALPFHKNRKPYEQVAFQFSHHVMERTGELRHKDEFLLAEAGVFPNYEFVRALRLALVQDQGSVFMWSAHENTVLNQIAEQLQADANPPADTTALLAFIKSLTKGGSRAMIDLRMLAQNGFFYPETQGSCSIKKVLPAVMGSSAFIRQAYSQPLYGVPGGMESHNFKGFAWWAKGADGRVLDPYGKLKIYATDLLGQGSGDEPQDQSSVIADGGAATTAYARLQFEDLSDEQRVRIKEAMLRYCELDTLAMAMVVQAWQADLLE